jgi:cell division septal protein FtsQ
MSQTSSKIFGLIIFLIIITTLFLIALIPMKNQDRIQIKSIDLSGNNLLPQSSYLNFAKLNNVQISTGVTLPIIQARLEKHPFVASADVEVSKSNYAKVHLSEKNLIAVLIINSQPFFLSDELQLLPHFQNSKYVELPVINNPKYEKQYKVLDYLSSEEIIEARKIFRAIQFTNEEMFKNLSEINLNHGDDITLTFSGIHPIIKIGQNEIPKKVLSLGSIWDDLKDTENELSRNDYVDLRSVSQIYLGKAEETEI